MPPPARATSTPGSAGSSGTRVSRQAFRCATSAGHDSSARAIAASAGALHEDAGARGVELDQLAHARRVSAAGSTSQPSRQPVIRKLLEKLWATTSRSSGSATSRKLGAQPSAVGSK